MKRAPKSVGSTPITNIHPLVQSVKEVLTTERLIPYGGCVVVGVSGGPDSTALLDMLWHLRHELGFKMAVAHFNHRIRREAGSDERFVGRLALKYQLPFMAGCAKHKAPSAGSLEDWARKERYQFFVKSAKKIKADAVILAHSADDLAETVLMRVIRGSGLQGLKGMGEKRVINQVAIIRPMLSIRKKEILQYLQKQKMDFCIDKTNAKTDFFRNKIRLELMPFLEKEYNANMTGALVHLSRSAADDYDYLYQQAASFWDDIVSSSFKISQGVVFEMPPLSRVHPSIRRVLIRMAYEHLKGDLNQLNFDHVMRVEQLLETADGRVELPAGIVAEKNKNHLFLRKSRLQS